MKSIRNLIQCFHLKCSFRAAGINLTSCPLVRWLGDFSSDCTDSPDLILLSYISPNFLTPSTDILLIFYVTIFVWIEAHVRGIALFRSGKHFSSTFSSECARALITDQDRSAHPRAYNLEKKKKSDDAWKKRRFHSMASFCAADFEQVSAITNTYASNLQEEYQVDFLLIMTLFHPRYRKHRDHFYPCKFNADQSSHRKIKTDRKNLPWKSFDFVGFKGFYYRCYRKLIFILFECVFFILDCKIKHLQNHQTTIN